MYKRNSGLVLNSKLISLNKVRAKLKNLSLKIRYYVYTLALAVTLCFTLDFDEFF